MVHYLSYSATRKYSSIIINTSQIPEDIILMGGTVETWGSILTHTGAVSSYSSQKSSSSSNSSSSLSWQPSDWHAGSQHTSKDQFCGAKGKVVNELLSIRLSVISHERRDSMYLPTVANREAILNIEGKRRILCKIGFKFFFFF